MSWLDIGALSDIPVRGGCGPPAPIVALDAG